MLYLDFTKIVAIRAGYNSIFTADYEFFLNCSEITKIINDIEKYGLGKQIHKEMRTGIDYLGKMAQFNCYLINLDYPNILVRINFDESIIPITLLDEKENKFLKIWKNNLEILSIKRDNKITDILDKD